VDDEDDVREFAANFFRRRKINVTTASSGEETLKLLDNAAPDLILLDIKMSGIDGIETLRQIRQKNTRIKVIMVTGKKPEEDGSIEKCREYGVHDYIHKPLELDELERLVMKELG
jgi:CheY-like chemotaxis protein